MTRATICTIGDEILIGQITDTNSAHISRALNSLGIKVSRMVSIGDNHDEIIKTLNAELMSHEIVIVTGGLGPTKDDITKIALAELSKANNFRQDERQLEIIHRILSLRGLDILDINIAQASVPDTCEVIPNHLGTAPIMVFRFPEERYGHKATLYSLPGVPFEALGALNDIIDDIKSNYQLSNIYHRTIMTYGIAESALSEMISEWEDNLPEDMHLAYLPNALTGVRLRLSIYGGDKIEQEARINAKLSDLKLILGDIIYSDHDNTLQQAVGEALKGSGKTISTAESCTGGMISSLLTSIPGASEYFLGAVTSYSNEIKKNILLVNEDILDKYGAVSSECVAAMADGVRRITGSDFSVATSGIAGPEGGTAEKPVGTVWIGVSSDNGTETYKLIFRNDRIRNIERFASSALHILLKKIKRELRN